MFYLGIRGTLINSAWLTDYGNKLTENPQPRFLGYVDIYLVQRLDPSSLLRTVLGVIYELVFTEEELDFPLSLPRAIAGMH